MFARERIRIWKNRVTGSWRVDVGGRSGYYCATFDQAWDRAYELVAAARVKASGALMLERHGDGSRP